LVAVFFFEPAQPPPSLDDLVRKAGLTEVRPLNDVERLALGFHEPDHRVLAGQWGAFSDTWAVLDAVDGFHCLQLYSSMNSYLDARLAAEERQAADEDAQLPYMATFRDACINLQPYVAFLDTRSHYGDERWENKQGNRDWVLSYARMVMEANVNALADERFSLLYLSEPLTVSGLPTRSATTATRSKFALAASFSHAAPCALA